MFTKGQYFPTFKVWDMASWWVVDKDTRSHKSIVTKRYHPLNSLTDSEWDTMAEAVRNARRLATRKEGTVLLAQKRQVRKERLLGHSVSASAKKMRTEEVEDELVRGTVETERAIVDTYEFSEGYLTDDLRGFLHGFREQKNAVLSNAGFTNVMKTLGGTEHEKAVRDDLFSLGLVVLHKSDFLETALDEGGSLCDKVEKYVTYLFEETQKKPPAKKDTGLKKPSPAQTAPAPQTKAAPQQKPPARMEAGTKRTSPAAAQQKPPAQMEAGTKKTSPAQTQAAQIQTPAQKNAAEK